MDGVDMITIPLKEYEGLLDESAMLAALEGAGVDNWQGYDDACTWFEEWKAAGDNT